MKPDGARIRLLRREIALVLDEQQATAQEGTSALASCLIAAFVTLLSDGQDGGIRAEMHRMAERMCLLADALPAEVVMLSQALADETVQQ